MKIITIDGERFHTKGGFYREVKAALCPELNMGMNLDALNDVLRGGFDETDDGEPLTVCWKSFEKSRGDLGDRMVLSILNVMLAVDSEHEVKVVLQTGAAPENTAIQDEALMLTVHGEDFSDLEGFYQAMDALLTNGETRTGHNLDALNDVLRGGFGVTRVGEPIALCWLDFDKSRDELGDKTLLDILTVMLSDGSGHDVHVVLA